MVEPGVAILASLGLIGTYHHMAWVLEYEHGLIPLRLLRDSSWGQILLFYILIIPALGADFCRYLTYIVRWRVPGIFCIIFLVVHVTRPMPAGCPTADPILSLDSFLTHPWAHTHTHTHTHTPLNSTHSPNTSIRSTRFQFDPTLRICLTALNSSCVLLRRPDVFLTQHVTRCVNTTNTSANPRPPGEPDEDGWYRWIFDNTLYFAGSTVHLVYRWTGLNMLAVAQLPRDAVRCLQMLCRMLAALLYTSEVTLRALRTPLEWLA